MNDNKIFSQKTPWSWTELIKLLFLVLVLVPIFIEYFLATFLLDILQNNLYSGTLVGLIMAIIFMAGLYGIALKPKSLSWEAVGLRKFAVEYWWKIIGWSITLIVLSIAVVVMLEMLIEVGPENTKTESLQSRMNPFNFIIGFVSAAVISPVYEEIFYRGFLYRFFRSQYGITIGLFVSSFIFMIVHIPTFNTLPINFISGLIFAWTYEKSGSVVPGMIIHGVFNGIAITLTALG